MSNNGWERIYRQRGDLQFNVLSKIRRLSRVFAIKNYEKILDLGCGTGRHSIFLARKGFSVYATDLSHTGITIAREKAKSLNLPNVHFRQHNMKTIPFPNNYFDAIICTWTIYHGTLDNIRKTIAEIFRVLKPGGMCITDCLSIFDSTYGRGKEIEKNTFIGEKTDEEDVPHHYTTEDELTDLFSEFREVRIRQASNSYTDERGESYVRKYFNIEASK